MPLLVMCSASGLVACKMPSQAPWRAAHLESAGEGVGKRQTYRVLIRFAVHFFVLDFGLLDYCCEVWEQLC